MRFRTIAITAGILGLGTLYAANIVYRTEKLSRLEIDLLCATHRLELAKNSETRELIAYGKALESYRPLERPEIQRAQPEDETSRALAAVDDMREMYYQLDEEIKRKRNLSESYERAIMKVAAKQREVARLKASINSEKRKRFTVF